MASRDAYKSMIIAKTHIRGSYYFLMLLSTKSDLWDKFKKPQHLIAPLQGSYNITFTLLTWSSLANVVPMSKTMKQKQQENLNKMNQ